jgi:hypothetical protein
LLNGCAIGLEAEHTRAELGGHFRMRHGVDRRPAAGVGVDPAVRRHHEVIGHEVGISRREARVEALHFLVRAFSVHIENIRLIDRNESIFVKAEPSH